MVEVETGLAPETWEERVRQGVGRRE
jgi:hypothetical protein